MNHHYVMTDHAGSSAIETLAPPEFAAADYPGWEALSLDAGALSFFMFRIAPGAAEFPLHAAPDEWIGYVVSGGGVLFAGDGEGKKLGQVHFAAGDFITFKPNTQHAWENGTEESKILFVKVA